MLLMFQKLKTISITKKIKRKKKMKTKTNILIIIFFFAAAFLAGCNKNDSVLGPNQNNQVSFQIAQQNGLNGGVEFLFQPSVDLKITRMITEFPAQQLADTNYNPNPDYIFSKDTLYMIGEYTGVVNGQKWNFNFTGYIPGQNNLSYDVTSNYTVQ